MRWKTFTGQTCPHGLKVYLIDGTYVRNHFHSQLIQGGNEFRYAFVPKNELWIAREVPEVERPFVLLHECIEREFMKKGWSYERAHTAAKRAENKERRKYRPGEIKRHHRHHP
jgi:hypothetical protein